MRSHGLLFLTLICRYNTGILVEIMINTSMILLISEGVNNTREEFLFSVSWCRIPHHHVFCSTFVGLWVYSEQRDCVCELKNESRVRLNNIINMMNTGICGWIPYWTTQTIHQDRKKCTTPLLLAEYYKEEPEWIWVSPWGPRNFSKPYMLHFIFHVYHKTINMYAASLQCVNFTSIPLSSDRLHCGFRFQDNCPLKQWVLMFLEPMFDIFTFWYLIQLWRERKHTQHSSLFCSIFGFRSSMCTPLTYVHPCLLAQMNRTSFILGVDYRTRLLVPDL